MGIAIVYLVVFRMCAAFDSGLGYLFSVNTQQPGGQEIITFFSGK